MKTAHKTLLTPPEYLQSKPDKMAKWRPRVRESVDWDAVLRSRDNSEVVQPTEPETSIADDAFGTEDDDNESEGKDAPIGPVSGPLTIGLIGGQFQMYSLSSMFES